MHYKQYIEQSMVRNRFILYYINTVYCMLYVLYCMLYIVCCMAVYAYIDSVQCTVYIALPFDAYSWIILPGGTNSNGGITPSQALNSMPS